VPLSEGNVPPDVKEALGIQVSYPLVLQVDIDHIGDIVNDANYSAMENNAKLALLGSISQEQVGKENWTDVSQKMIGYGLGQSISPTELRLNLATWADSKDNLSPIVHQLFDQSNAKFLPILQEVLAGSLNTEIAKFYDPHIPRANVLNKNGTVNDAEVAMAMLPKPNTELDNKKIELAQGQIDEAAERQAVEDQQKEAAQDAQDLAAKSSNNLSNENTSGTSDDDKTEQQIAQLQQNQRDSLSTLQKVSRSHKIEGSDQILSIYASLQRQGNSALSGLAKVGGASVGLQIGGKAAPYFNGAVDFNGLFVQRNIIGSWNKFFTGLGFIQSITEIIQQSDNLSTTGGVIVLSSGHKGISLFTKQQKFFPFAHVNPQAVRIEELSPKDHFGFLLPSQNALSWLQ